MPASTGWLNRTLSDACAGADGLLISQRLVKRVRNLPSASGSEKSSRFSLLSKSLTCLSMSADGERIRQGQGGAHHARQRRIGQDLVEGGEGGRLALEVEREANALVVFARILLERLTQVFVDHGL